MSNATTVGLVYDFDGTLAKGDCAEHGLMAALRITDKSAFWREVKRKTKENDGDEILAYLGLLADTARELQSDALSVKRLAEFGRCIPLMPGVADWFPRINAYGSDSGLAIVHYVISSGLEGMILGTPIAAHMRRIFACKYTYLDDQVTARWPSLAINYTTKTQFLFRINKGIDNNWDNEGVNRFTEPGRRPLPFDRMIYLGDGDTDIPSMKMVRYQGGYSLAVFDNDRWNEKAMQDKMEKLISEERCNYVVPSDYSEGGQLDVTIKGLLGLIRRKTAG